MLLHVGNNVAEQFGGLPGDIFHRAVGAELIGGEETVAQLGQLPLLFQFQDRDFVENGLHPRKVGAYLYPPEGRYNQQRRGFQIDLVAEQLVERAWQLIVAALELPAESVFQVSVGKTTGNPLFKGESVRVAVGYWSRMTYQGAEVQEHFLRRLLFTKLSVAPLGDELRWRHCGEWGVIW